MLPLVEWTRPPAVRPTRIELDVVLMSTSPASSTVTLPLAVWSRQYPRQVSTAMLPDEVRSSSASTSSTRMLELDVVTRASPNRPRSSTLPELVPTRTSVPAGQRTSRLDDEARTTTPPSSSSSIFALPSTTMSGRSSPVIKTRPDEVVTVRLGRSRMVAAPSSRTDRAPVAVIRVTPGCCHPSGEGAGALSASIAGA